MLRAFLFILMISVSASAQTASDIHGKVIIDLSERKPNDIIVHNKTKAITKKTLTNGHFTISASVGDSLVFSGDFIETRAIRVSAYHIHHEFTIHLNEEVVQLAELEVKKPLTGNYQNDMTLKPDTQIEDLYRSLGLNIRERDKIGKARESVATYKSFPRIGSSIVIPLTLDPITFLKSVSGYYRKLDNLYTYEDFNTKIETVHSFLGKDYFEKDLGIPKGESYVFIMYAFYKNKEAFNQYYLEKNYLELDGLLRKSAKEYKNRANENQN